MIIYALMLVVVVVLAATFCAVFRTLPQGPRALLALAAVLTAAAGLVGAISSTALIFI